MFYGELIAHGSGRVFLLLFFFLCYRRLNDLGVLTDFVVDVFEEDGLRTVWVEFGWVAWEVLVAVGVGLHVACVGEDVADGVGGVDDGVNRAFQWWRVRVFDDGDAVWGFDDSGVVANFVVNVFEEDELWAIRIEFGWIAWEVLVTVGVGLCVAGIGEDVTDGVCGAGDSADSGSTRRWLERLIGEDFVVHWWNVDAVFFDGIAAGWIVFAVCVAFQSFGLADDVAHFAEKADDVMLDDGGSVFQGCLVFRLAEFVHGEFRTTHAFAHTFFSSFCVRMVVFMMIHSHCPFHFYMVKQIDQYRACLLIPLI